MYNVLLRDDPADRFDAVVALDADRWWGPPRVRDLVEELDVVR